MMLIFWAVTPLQSAIFGTQAVSVTTQMVTSSIAQLGTLEEQLDALDSSILNTAYGITWLKQPFPAFTTPTHAITPFEPVKAGAAILPDETWTASAVALSTDLHCWPAVVNKTDVADTFEFDNGQGCKATLEPSSHGRLGNETGVIHTVLYIGYYEDATLDWYLENPNCSTEASHQFLAIWIAQDTKDMTALFCEPSYSKQTVMVTVSAADKRPDETSMGPLEDAKLLSEDEFNSTAFEYFIGTGVPPKLMRRDYPKDRTLEQFPTLSDFNLAFPITNMVGFAVGGMNYSITDLRDAAALQDIFASAHKKLFSAAIPSLLQSADLSSSARPSTVQYTLYGVVVSRPLALAVEILLFVIALLIAAILYLSHRTKSILREDPGSIAATLAVLGDSDALRRDFAPRDRYDDAALRKSVQGNRYKLAQTATVDGERLHIEYSRLSEHNDALDPQSNAVSDEHVQPQALRPLSGLAFVVTVLAGMVVLLYLKRQVGTLGGWSLLATGQETSTDVK
jgi:hypothetical protein